jgi:threonine/homoserine/homoserine lactone efflux protein
VSSFSWFAGFLLVALVVTLTPGPATAMVIRVAARDGRVAALRTIGGHSLGVLVWGALSAVGVSSLILASDIAYGLLRIVGAAVLIWLGVRTWWLTRRAAVEVGGTGPESDSSEAATARAWWVRSRSPWGVGLVTSVSNPKLAVFFVALFPQFVPHGAPVLPKGLVMVGVIGSFDLIWYSALAVVVHRAKRAFVEGPWSRRFERLTGAVLVGLGVRLALERR